MSLNQEKTEHPPQFQIIVADVAPAYTPQFQTDVLICSADCAVQTASQFPNATVITYGMGTKQSVTLSACSDNVEMVCFQREITPLIGDAPALGEVSVPVFNENPNTGLAIAAVFRHLGIV